MSISEKLSKLKEWQLLSLNVSLNLLCCYVQSNTLLSGGATAVSPTWVFNGLAPALIGFSRSPIVHQPPINCSPIANIDKFSQSPKLVHRFINYLKGLNKQNYFRPVIERRALPSKSLLAGCFNRLRSDFPIGLSNRTLSIQGGRHTLNVKKLVQTLES